MIRYAITDRRFLPGDERGRRNALLRQARALASAGVDFLQLREKDLSPRSLLALARALRNVLPRGSRPRLLLNGEATLAAEAQADGLHLPGGWSGADLEAARSAFRSNGLPAPVLSLSAHSLDEVRAARVAGPDLILFGPVFEKRVHGDVVRPGVGLGALALAAQAARPVPLLALGGVAPPGIPACLSAGASGVAAIRMFRSPVSQRPAPGDPAAVQT